MREEGRWKKEEGRCSHIFPQKPKQNTTKNKNSLEIPFIYRNFALQKWSNGETEFAVRNYKCYDYSKRTIRQRPRRGYIY